MCIRDSTNYGVTDSIVCSERAIWPMYERKTDYNIWKDLGLACGQTEEDWPWPELEDAYFHVLSPLGLPITSYNDFVERFRMYYPPLQYQKYLQKGQDVYKRQSGRQVTHGTHLR